MSDGNASLDPLRRVDKDHPWPGLIPFGEAQRDFFFGRRKEQEELFRCVQRGTATLLFGQSGLGKTSLLQAGLFPQLRENGYLPILVRLDYAREAEPPFDQVKQLLQEAIAAAALESPPLTNPDETLWEYLHRRDLRLIDRFSERLTPVICFDQFEELFTLGRSQDGAEYRRFLDDLADLLENRPPAAVKERFAQNPAQMARYALSREDYRIILTIREDYLSSLEELRTIAPSLGRSRLRLTRMKGPQALEAVVEPGRAVVDDAVAHRIVRLVGNANRDLPLDDIEVESSLLSLFCSELNERRLRERLPMISPAILEVSGHDILESFYERALSDQPAAVRRFIEDELVTESGARDNIARERAERLLADRGVNAGVIDELVQRRLLHIEERREGPRVELIHDVLLGVVRQQKGARTALDLREVLAQTRKRYVRRAIIAAAIVLVLAAAGVFYTEATLQTNTRITAQNELISEQNRRLSEQNKILSGYRDRSKHYVTQINPLLQQLVAQINRLRTRVQGGTAGPRDTADEPAPTGDVGLEPDYGLSSDRSMAILSRDVGEFLPRVRALIENILEFMNELRALAPDDIEYMRAQATAVTALLRLQIGDDLKALERYGDLASTLAAELLQRGRDGNTIATGCQTFSAAGFAFENAGHLQKALDLARRAAVEIEALNTDLLPEADRFVKTICVALNLGEQGSLLRRLGRLDESDQHLQRALERSRQMATTHSLIAALLEEHGDILLARAQQTTSLLRQHLTDRALKAFEDSWEQRNALLKQSDTVQNRTRQATTAGRVARVFEDQKNLPKARQYYRYQLQARRSLIPIPDSKKLSAPYDVEAAIRAVLDAQRAIGFLERTQGDPASAIAILKECIAEAIALAKKSPLPINQQSLGYCYYELANVYQDLKAYQEARDNFAQASAALAQALVDPALERAAHFIILSLRRQATASLRLHQPEEAARLSLQAISLARQVRQRRETEESTSDLVSALGSASWNLLFVGRSAEAIAFADQALKLSPKSSWIEVNRANGIWLQGRTDEAEQIYLKLKNHTDDILNDFKDLLEFKLVTAEQVQRIRTLLGVQ